jgi:ankyrin repeat protein
LNDNLSIYQRDRADSRGRLDVGLLWILKENIMRRRTCLVELGLGISWLTVSSAFAQSLSLFADRPIARAVLTGDVDVVQAALAQGENPNRVTAAGQPLLMVATQKRHLAVTEALLDAGAFADIEDQFGNTPLMRAAEVGALAIIDLLIAAGADPDHLNLSGRTALMAAAEAREPDAVAILLTAGADPALGDITGRTALDWAYDGRDREVIRLLESAR